MRQIGGGPPDYTASLSAVACPSSEQCTAVDDLGHAVTFDPAAPRCAATTVVNGGRAIATLTCEGRAAVGRLVVQRGRTRAPIECLGFAWALCTVQLRLTATEVIRGGKVIAVSAAAAKRRQARRRTVELGGVIATVRSGQRHILSVALNSLGERLLAHRHTLRLKLTISQPGHVVLSRPITIRARPNKGRTHSNSR
jgi:hypothetical protein